ncbi:MAG TPA: hypothetical protein VNT24_00105 [Propionibacteriaceae bacterium]|nr:hypothetical protein [Propionibacteriaceae bacterium]
MAQVDTAEIGQGGAGRRHPFDRRLSDLIGELTTRSEQFRSRWAAHNVQIHTTGVKLLHHPPVVGDLDLPFESLPLAADLSHSLVTYTPRTRNAHPGGPQPASQLAASTTPQRSAAARPRPQGRPAPQPRILPTRRRLKRPACRGHPEQR